MSDDGTSPEFDLKKTVSGNRLVGLWRMLSGFRLAYLGAVAAVAIAAALRTGYYLLLRYLVDDVLTRENLGHALPLIGLGFVGLALAQGTFTFLSGKWTARTAEGIARRLRDYLFDHIQRLSFTYHDQMDTGELIQRVTSDLDAVRRFFANQAIGMGRIVLLFLINFTALLRLNTKLALISVVVALPVLGISIFFFKRISKAYEEFQEREAKLSTTLQENLSGVRVVKAFAQQAHEIGQFERDNRNQYRAGRRLLTLHSLFWPSTNVLCGLQMVAGMFAGALMAIDGTISVGTYLAYTGLVVRVIWPLRGLGRIIVNMSTGLVSYKRVLKLIREDREPLEEGTYRSSGSLQGEVTFQNVHFQYDGDESPALEDITFHCEPGQVVALLGLTGSGKTSLVNLLPRFYEVTRGTVLLDGVELSRYPRRYLRQQIGIVEQEPFLFSRDIRENITYGVSRDVSQEEIEAVARMAAIHDVIRSFSEGYDTKVGEKGVTLSGGQKQRVAIARTLLKDPRILILDDATSSVDTETEAEIHAAMRQVMQDRTTFIIGHRVRSVMDADLILVLNDGRIVERGAHEDLIAQDGIYRRIYELQARIEGELDREIGELKGMEVPHAAA